MKTVGNYKIPQRGDKKNDLPNYADSYESILTDLAEGKFSVAGLPGPQGEPGQQGAPGATGDTGTQGPAGSPGVKGDQGIQGMQGLTGDTGAQGSTGPQGSPGTTGAKGDNGDTGLTGPKGDVGDQGPQGIQGVQGVKGDTGNTGNTGSAGPNQVTTSTATNITGIIKGNGSVCSQASAGSDYVATNDSRLTDSRNAADVSAWAKAATKPSYTAAEVGALASGGTAADVTVSGTNIAAALSGKVSANGAITGATNTKITYDAKGLVTAGAAATTADIADSTDKRYCTDAQKTVIGNTSGTNTGDNSANSSSMYIGTTSHALNRASAAETIAGLTLTTPNIGAASGTSLAVTGAITSSGGGQGYTAGAGGTQTQSSSKSTGVTLSKLCGTITMNGAALAAATTVAFTLTNTFIAATDMVIVQHASAGTLGAYNFAVAPASGSVVISVRNIHTASLSEAIVLRFFVLKAVTA